MIKRIALAATAIVLCATVAAAADDHRDDHKTVVDRTVINKTVVRPRVAHGWASKSDYRRGGPRRPKRLAKGDK